MRNLGSRLLRLEQLAPYRPSCQTCGADLNPYALVGTGEDGALPEWIVDGRCRACRRTVRVYVGVDLARV